MKYAILFLCCLLAGCVDSIGSMERSTDKEPKIGRMANLPDFMGHRFGDSLKLESEESIDGIYRVAIKDDLVEAVANFEVVDGILVSVVMPYSRPSFDDMISAYSAQAGIGPGKNLEGKLGWKFRNGTMTIDEEKLVILWGYEEDVFIPSTSE